MTDNNLHLVRSDIGNVVFLNRRNHSVNYIYDCLNHHHAFEFASPNRSQQSALKCKGFHNLHGLLPEGIVYACGCVYEQEREIKAESERETRKEGFDLATVSGEPLLQADSGCCSLVGIAPPQPSGLIKTLVSNPESFCSDSHLHMCSPVCERAASTHHDGEGAGGGAVTSPMSPPPRRSHEFNEQEQNQ